jgi:hypothetical protein
MPSRSEAPKHCQAVRFKSRYLKPYTLKKLWAGSIAGFYKTNFLVIFRETRIPTATYVSNLSWPMANSIAGIDA